MKKLVFSIFSFFLLIIFVGCGSIPRPFKKNKSNPKNDLVYLTEQNDVAVHFANDNGGMIRESLGRAVAGEITQHKLLAYYKDRGSSQFILYGSMEGWRGSDAIAPPFRVRWFLKDRSGNILGTYLSNVYGTVNSWLYDREPIINENAKNISKSVVETIYRQTKNEGSTIATSRRIWIEPVKNVLGGDDLVLTRAMQDALKAIGLEVAKEKQNSVQVLIGRMKIAGSSPKGQKLEILWILKDHAGVEIGKARQKNYVTKEVLERQWGDLAYSISTGVARAIKEISDKQRTFKRIQEN